MGFVFIVAGILYLLISMGVVIWAISYAKKYGKSAKRWGWGAALGMYLLVFWDWIPTVVTHQYYCATEAGFWVYKTPAQWMKENPGVMEGLVVNNGYPSSHIGDMMNYTDTNFLNQRFNLVYKHQGPLFLHRWMREDTLVDIKNNEILARYVEFTTSQERRQAGWSGWKFWLDSSFWMDSGYCSEKNAIESGKWINQFKGGGK